MNIEQIALEVRLSMLRDFNGLSKDIDIDVKDETEFLRRCLSKLAEQDMEPFGYYENGRFSVSSDGGRDKRRERKEYTGAIYTETQLLAAQQRTAEACANVAEDSEQGAVMSKYASIRECEAARHRAALIKEAIRNGDWREYL